MIVNEIPVAIKLNINDNFPIRNIFIIKISFMEIILAKKITQNTFKNVRNNNLYFILVF